MILVLSLHGFYLDPGILDIFIQPMGLFANLSHATIGSVISSSGPTRFWLCYKTGNQFVYGAPVDGYPASSTSVPGGPYQDPHIDSRPTSIPAQSGDSHPKAGAKPPPPRVATRPVPPPVLSRLACVTIQPWPPPVPTNPGYLIYRQPLSQLSTAHCLKAPRGEGDK